MDQLRIGLAQINTVVGDLDGNTRCIIQGINRAKELGVDVVAFPEMAITGYPPEDLLLKADFIEDNLARLEEIAQAATGIVAIC